MVIIFFPKETKLKGFLSFNILFVTTIGVSINIIVYKLAVSILFILVIKIKIFIEVFCMGIFFIQGVNL